MSNPFASILKKNSVALLLVICLLLTVAVRSDANSKSAGKWPFSERNDIVVSIQNEVLSGRDPVLQQQGRMLLPFRPLLLALGVPNDAESIRYDADERLISVFSDFAAIELRVASRMAYVNNEQVTLDVAPLIHPRTGRVYVPVRFVAEQLRHEVKFDGAKKRLTVLPPAPPLTDSEPTEPLTPEPEQVSEQQQKPPVTPVQPPDKPVQPPTVTPSVPAPPVYVEPRGIVRETSADGRTFLFNKFPASQLKNERTIRVYVPARYSADPTARFPVVYMHDGQNLLGAGSTFGSWKVDRTADELTAAGIIDDVIIVGIDNTPNRANEYNYSGGGIVDQYSAFLANEVVPFINATFRTLKGPEHTTIIGSSYGGNAALYTGWHHPHVFGNIGAFSSTLIWNDFALLNKIRDDVKAGKKPLKLCLYIGDREKLDEDGNGLANYAEWTVELAQLLIDHGWTVGQDLTYQLGANAVHNEASWAAYIDQPLRFFYAKNKQASAEKMEIKLSVPEIDTKGTVPNVWAFPYVTYTNGVRTIQPNAVLNAQALSIVNRTFDKLTLKSGTSTAPQTLRLNYTLGSLNASADLKIVSGSANKVKVRVELLAPLSNVQKVYMTGDFSAWGQNINSDYTLQRNGERNGRAYYWADLVLDKNKTLTFKFRAGPDWKFVEKTATDGNTLNRELKTADKDINAPYTVERWNSVP
jgi:predicted alpha/beta superfamily hydrolase